MRGKRSCPGAAPAPRAVELWKLDENETLSVSKFCKYKHDDIMSTVSVLSSGTKAVSGSKDFCIKVWDFAQQMVLNSYQGCSASGYLPTSLAWHPQQSEVFVFGDENGTVSLVDTKSASCALSSAVHSQCVTGLVFSPHSAPFLVSVSEDCSLAVLDSGFSEL
ncbi:methylosome protein WDR77-like [Mesoplodon densirostris]|uniref:methylosome protein WDR77-like n=1 Tax=Mesoplodon densirostris TaxID=48708 RepID=UPI0028DB1D64|nr:methylosome protein WDR77-like [Mesoplodon densirostris]